MDKDIDEVLEESTEKAPLPESPASLNVRGYLKGYSIQITKRGEVAQPLLEQSIKIVEWMELNGFKPSWNEATNSKKYANTPTGQEFPDDKAPETSTCATCGEVATFRQGVSKTGKKWTAMFCSSENRSHSRWL